ncbi:hypothetical protein TWF696_001805 [Orbilia brochopaga]|uniref:Uncharacterized protein n=1 Tax=Orbilia brochopaga TaxID=3140254 RepID=A0AAV9U5K9_9PEZI
MRFTIFLTVAAATAVYAAPILNLPHPQGGNTDGSNGLITRAVDCDDDNAGFEVPKGLPRRPIKEPPLQKREECKKAKGTPANSVPVEETRRIIKEPPL